jgi:predicted transcriptional regulator
MSDNNVSDVLSLTAEIVSAHISNNQVETAALPALIQAVYRSLTTAGDVDVPAAAPVPAVPWKKSVFPEFIVCLEDGKKLKMLKRHLKTSYNLTPDEYRRKWGLPNDYPMVAPSYASHRSALAKSIGLGRKSAAPSLEPVASKPPGRRAKVAKA